MESKQSHSIEDEEDSAPRSMLVLELVLDPKAHESRSTKRGFQTQPSMESKQSRSIEDEEE
jgi:hypothetical protein